MMKTFDTHKSTEDVRQADSHKTNFRVLIISTALVIIALAAVYLVFAMNQGGGA